MRIKIIDLNRALIQAAKAEGLDAIWGDYFDEARNLPKAVLITASNPMWSFGGGIDWHFKNRFPDECKEKQERGGGMERIGNIVFAVTVDENYKATPKIITKALKFGLSQLKEGEVLVVSGLGTGIGGLPVKEFCRIVKELV